MNSSNNILDNPVLWQSTSSSYDLQRPLNLSNDTDYPGTAFKNHQVNGLKLTLRQYDNVEVMWYNYGIYVIDSQGNQIPHLCYLYGEAPPVESLRVADPQLLAGVTASIMHWVPGNYCHIVCEHISLLQALAEAGQLDRIDYLLHDSWASNLLKDAREIYETKAEAIGVGKVGHIRCATLLAFEPVSHPAHWGHEVLTRFFDRIRDRRQIVAPWRRLIVTRPVGRRGFSNLPELVQALPDFDVIDLERPMSLFEQAQLFSEAKIVICGHGAALTNLVFMQPGTGVVEIFNHNYGMATYWVLAGARKVKYCASIDIRGSTCYDDSGKDSDMIVDVPDIVRSVDFLTV